MTTVVKNLRMTVGVTYDARVHVIFMDDNGNVVSSFDTTPENARLLASDLYRIAFCADLKSGKVKLKEEGPT